MTASAILDHAASIVRAGIVDLRVEITVEAASAGGWFNRVPEKAFVEYLRLIGLALRPPAAAAVKLQFRSDQPATAPIPIPRGVRVSVNRVSGGNEPPVFSTDDPASIEVGQQSVTVPAHHCDFIEGELIGTGTGEAAQAVVVGQPPIIASTGNELDLVVGVEAARASWASAWPPASTTESRSASGRRPDSFVNRKDETVYVADVSPAASCSPRRCTSPETTPMRGHPAGRGPAAGREIRAWYRRGGGSAETSRPERSPSSRTPCPECGRSTIPKPRRVAAGRAARRGADPRASGAARRRAGSHRGRLRSHRTQGRRGGRPGAGVHESGDLGARHARHGRDAAR